VTTHLQPNTHGAASGGKPSAIVVVDMVADMFIPPELAAQRDGLVTAINKLLAHGREAGHLIVWVRQEFAEDLSDAPLQFRLEEIHRTIGGTPGAMLLPELDSAPGDTVIIKKRYSAFFGTRLHEYLQAQGTRSVVVVGVNTHACVRTTAIDAYQHDYPVYVITDCVGSYDLEHHEISLRYIDGKIGTVLPLADFITIGEGSSQRRARRKPSVD
jgi:nicotinamidase-related amidase